MSFCGCKGTNKRAKYKRKTRFSFVFSSKSSFEGSQRYEIFLNSLPIKHNFLRKTCIIRK